MNQKSLRKEYINNFVKGFTLMELLVGSLIASVACLAIIYSATYYTQRLQSIKTKERALTKNLRDILTLGKPGSQ